MRTYLLFPMIRSKSLPPRLLLLVLIDDMPRKPTLGFIVTLREQQADRTTPLLLEARVHPTRLAHLPFVIIERWQRFTAGPHRAEAQADDVCRL